MKRVGYVYDDIFLEHDTGSGHPESPERLRAIERAIAPLKDKLVEIAPFSVDESELLRVHLCEMIEKVQYCTETLTPIDSDTICSEHSYDVAKTAVGAGLAAIDAISEGKIERAFCAVRPPGHHATSVRSMGFCLFNNIAVAARYAQSKGYKKVFIVDFDVHHGNGTQEIFYDDDTVFYFSSHQTLAYPGTGMENETGTGRGLGYTRNVLLMPDSGDAEIEDIYRNDLPPLIKDFQPDIVLVSAGYDIHESDPLAQLYVTTEGIRHIVREILHTVDVPYVFFLEGGYHVEALGENVKVTIEEMLKD
jgi:acetoin utilization deacetylase AcuC-like enzyme